MLSWAIKPGDQCEVAEENDGANLILSARIPFVAEAYFSAAARAFLLLLFLELAKLLQSIWCFRSTRTRYQVFRRPRANCHS